jgi:hypothetical protein
MSVALEEMNSLESHRAKAYAPFSPFQKIMDQREVTFSERRVPGLTKSAQDTEEMSREELLNRWQMMRRPAPGPSAQARGYNFLSTLRGIHRHGGADALRAILTQLSNDDLQVLKPLVENVDQTRYGLGWYPFSLLCRLYNAVENVMDAAGAPDYLFNLGEEMGQADAETLIAGQVPRDTPAWLFEKTEMLWSQFHDCGTWNIERTPVSMIATLENHPNQDHRFCTVFMGWIMGAVNQGTENRFQGAHPICRARGAPHCVFTCRWE